MKICLISNLYPPYNRGGAEQVVKNTVEGLVARGHQVVVITARPFRVGRIFNFQFSIFNQFSNPNDQFPNKSQISNLKSKILNQNPQNPRIYRFFPFNLFFYGNDYKYPSWVRFFWHIFDVFNLHSYFVIRRILQKERPDIVHTHNLKGLGYLIPRAIRGLGLRHVHTLHDVQLVEPSGIIIKGQEKSWRYNGWPVRVYAAICRWLFGSPPVIVSPSKFLLDFYEKRGFFPRSKKIVLPNPVVDAACHCEYPHYDIASPAESGINSAKQSHDQKMNEIASSLRSSQNRDRDSFHFLYLGQIEEHKGILFLIKVFKSSIFNLQSSIFLHIVGAGSKLEEAKHLAIGCSQIIFHGKIDRESLPAIFQQTDIAIVPSLCYENSPTVIFESFSFGRPVLASSIEGVAELIREGENGLTFEAGDEASLMEKLRWCLENQEKIRAMRGAALKSVEGLGLRSYLDKLLDLCYNRQLT